MRSSELQLDEKSARFDLAAKLACSILATLILWAGSAPVKAEGEEANEAAGSSGQPATEEVQPVQKPSRPGWEVEVGLGFVVHFQDLAGDASVDWSIQPTPADPDCHEQGLLACPTLSFAGGRNDPALAPGFSLELVGLSPALWGARYAPRVFAHVGYQALLEDSPTAYRKYSSEALSSASCAIPIQWPVPGQDQPGLSMPLTGSCDSSVKVDTSIDGMWYLGVGFEVPLPFFEDRMKFRLAADYLGQQWGPQRFSWERNKSWNVCTGPNRYLNSNNNCKRSLGGPPQFDPAGARIKVAQTDNINVVGPGGISHAIGTNLQALVDVYQWKQIRVRLFLETRFVWLIDDPDMELTVSVVDGLIRASVVPDTFIAQGGGGIRVYWAPVLW